MLGSQTETAANPESAVLEKVPSGHAGTDYVRALHRPGIHLALPDDGAAGLCPYRDRLLPNEMAESESKSLKLFLHSFRNHGAFHEDCSIYIAKRLVELLEPKVAQDRRLLVSPRRYPDRRLLADRQATGRCLAAGSGRTALSRAWVS